MRTNHNTSRQGFIMPVLLFTVSLIMLMIATITSLSISTYNLASRESYKVNAQFTADSGLDIGIKELNADPAWAGTTGEVTLLDTPNLRTTYQTTMINGATSDLKTMSVTARSYSPSTASTPKITRKYEVDVRAVTSGIGLTSVVTGVGGLIMNNNSKITGGDVVVNGTIVVNNNAQIGLSTTVSPNIMNVHVAHTNCPSPADATYPRVCGPVENGQPMTVNGRIYADVKATNQTNAANMFNPGLDLGATAPVYTLPDYDRADHIANKAGTNRNSTDVDIACGNNQTKTWPADVKITGNISLGNNCTVNIVGNVWLTGNLTFGNNARIVVSNTLGATRPTFMIDGSSGLVTGNNSQVVPNSSSTGIFFITYWSAAACSPDCASVTGTDLKNSQNSTTITLSNNSSAPNSILYARWSRVDVSNNGALGAVAGQSIQLGNNAVINFTASVPGSTNLTQTWVKRGYMRVFD